MGTRIQPERRYSAAYIYNQIRSTPTSCVGGSNYVDAMNLLRREGIATLADFPYDERSCSAIPSQAVKQRAREFAVADWRRVNVQDEAEVKTQIASGFPVLIGMMVDDAFSRLAGDQVYAANGGANRGGHAMVVVGYSDQRNAFKLINSWGTNWGSGGFGWISYSAFRQTVREGFVVQDIVVNTPNTQNVTPVAPTPVPQPPPPINVNLSTPQMLHEVQVQTLTGF